jgi:hypothetical protein
MVVFKVDVGFILLLKLICCIFILKVSVEIFLNVKV